MGSEMCIRDSFQDMKARIEEEMVRYLFWLRPIAAPGEDEAALARAVAPRPAPRRASQLSFNNPGAEPVPAFAGASRSAAAVAQAPAPTPARTGGDDVIKTVRREEPKVGRNDPCPCGSGKKYKKCHGAAA